MFFLSYWQCQNRFITDYIPKNYPDTNTGLTICTITESGKSISIGKYGSDLYRASSKIIYLVCESVSVPN